MGLNSTAQGEQQAPPDQTHFFNFDHIYKCGLAVWFSRSQNLATCLFSRSSLDLYKPIVSWFRSKVRGGKALVERSWEHAWWSKVAFSNGYLLNQLSLMLNSWHCWLREKITNRKCQWKYILTKCLSAKQKKCAVCVMATAGMVWKRNEKDVKGRKRRTKILGRRRGGRKDNQKKTNPKHSVNSANIKKVLKWQMILCYRWVYVKQGLDLKLTWTVCTEAFQEHRRLLELWLLSILEGLHEWPCCLLSDHGFSYTRVAFFWSFQHSRTTNTYWKPVRWIWVNNVEEGAQRVSDLSLNAN